MHKHAHYTKHKSTNNKAKPRIKIIEREHNGTPPQRVPRLNIKNAFVQLKYVSSI